jgi:hypothetical protein
MLLKGNFGGAGTHFHFLHTSAVKTMEMSPSTSKITLQKHHIINFCTELSYFLQSWNFIILALVEPPKSCLRDLKSLLSTLHLQAKREATWHCFRAPKNIKNMLPPVVLMFLGALKQCHVASRLACKCKVDSSDLRSRRHDFGGSTRAKIMKLHDCKKYYNSMLKFIILCFGRVMLEVSGLISIVFTVDMCAKIWFSIFFIIFLGFRFLSLVLANIDTFGV